MPWAMEKLGVLRLFHKDIPMLIDFAKLILPYVFMTFGNTSWESLAFFILPPYSIRIFFFSKDVNI